MNKIKVKDFSKTWCKLTEENYKGLIYHGVPDNYYESYKDRYDDLFNSLNAIILIEETEIDTGGKAFIDEIGGLEEIELIAGDFYYVEGTLKEKVESEKAEDKVIKVNRVEIITENGREVVYNPFNNIFYELSFQDNGETLKIFKREKPKEWYEKENAFPCLVIEDGYNIIHCKDFCEWVDLDKHHKGTFRPATKQEVLKLVKED